MQRVGKIHPDGTPFSITFPCIPCVQPIGELYSGVLPHDILYTICEFDVRRVIYEERDVERYLGVQRPLSNSRVKELSDYVNFTDATFPSAIIIAVDERCVAVDPSRKTMTLMNVDDPESPVPKRMIARVIDGQHRVAGLKFFTPKSERDRFDCLVTILVGMDIADQGHVFATVNLAQTKVNRSLAIDLYALEKIRSPMKTCHTVVVALDRHEKGPFFKKIKRLGVTTAGRSGETLTQATVVDGLMPYISGNPDRDRDALLRGQRLPLVDAKREPDLLFRNWFIEGEDGKIARTFSNFFEAIADKWPTAWGRPGPGIILGRTTGYRALARLFGDIYHRVGGMGTVASKEAFAEYIAHVPLEGDDFNSERYLPGSTGQGALYRELRAYALRE